MGGTPVMKLIEPPHAQLVFALFPSAGKPAGPTLTVDEPGLHGATVTGRHGIGVSTPRAAAVAAATCGFEGDEHIPKGGMFIPGAKSMIVPIGMFDARTVGAEEATKDEGAAPNEHVIVHPVLTACGIPLHLSDQRCTLRGVVRHALANPTPWSRFADRVIVEAVLAAASSHADDADPAISGSPRIAELLEGLASDTEPDLEAARREFHAQLDGTSLSVLALNGELTPAETETLALCVAVESDVRRQRIIGWLHDDPAATRVSLDLLGRLLGPDHPGALTAGGSSGPVRAAFIDVTAEGPWGSWAIAVEPAVMWALAGEARPDPDLPHPTRFHVDETDTEVRHPLVFVTGPDRIRRRRSAAANLAARQFLVVPPDPAESAWRAVVREATLRGAGIIVEATDGIPLSLRRWIERATHLPWAVTSEFEIAIDSLPDRPWREFHASGAQADETEWSASFGLDTERHGHRLSPEQLDQAFDIATRSDRDLHGAVKRLSSGPLDRLARRVRPRRTWNDLILDDDRQRQLQELVARYRNSDVVYDRWGFPAVPSSGLIALFSGDPGTGKTLSAEVVAGELGLDLFVVDLATVVSKYIGETEKNLEEVFDAAAVGNQVLFFDEADSLFGRRTEVSDARDRYANLEVSYLLQRLEIFGGLVVLATNLVSNIDPAFMRRIDIAIDYVLPEETERRRLWEISFPAGAPLHDDVNLSDLAARFKIAGGSIRKAALYAAFLAAEDDTPITPDLISLALEREYKKLGRLRPGG